MRPACTVIRRLSVLPLYRSQRRSLLTLAIETSCDDTSVAILEKHDHTASLHFHSKITSDNRSYGGVHPLVAAESHQINLATLVKTALQSLPNQTFPSDLSKSLLVESVQDKRDGRVALRKKPDFVTVTRGPGIRSSLMSGFDLAKGLSVAWQVPLLGVNHMQAHALTPRLVNALDRDEHNEKLKLGFPFLSLLVSGGHTMLVHSKSLCDHEIIADTADIAIGDMMDKCARDILPPEYLQAAKDVMYGKLLESFVFPDKLSYNDYSPPSSFTRFRTSTDPAYDWGINPPYSNPGDCGSIGHAHAFTFSGIGSGVKQLINRRPDMENVERRMLGRVVMEVAFEHLASRVLFALGRPEMKDVRTLVVSGGVASNQYLKRVLRENLPSSDPDPIQLVFPPPEFCTDNAAMIAWTGMEMYEAGWRTMLEALVVRKWAIDPRAGDGGILGLEGWEKVET